MGVSQFPDSLPMETWTGPLHPVMSSQNDRADGSSRRSVTVPGELLSPTWSDEHADDDASASANAARIRPHRTAAHRQQRTCHARAAHIPEAAADGGAPSPAGRQIPELAAHSRPRFVQSRGALA